MTRARGSVTVNVTYAHRICLIGKQHGGLAYTLTLLPGETMTLYQSDRYRRTTAETERYSTQTTFSQFVSALYQQQTSNDSRALVQVLNSQTQSASASGGGGVNLGFVSFGGGGGASSSSSSTTAADLSAQASASQFASLAEQAAQYTDLQRSITVSSYEDSETVSTTKRTLVDNNRCYAVNYFVRKVLDVYESTTTVTSIKLEREQAEAQRIGLQVQLMALEVQRRQALLAAGTLTAFEPDPTETIVA